MYRSDSYKYTLQLSKYLRRRDRVVWFSFGDFDSHEKCFKKYKPKTINYRSYKNFPNEKYRETLINNLPKVNFINNDDDFQRFCHIRLDALNKHAPSKKRHTWGNQRPYFNKELSKAIMTRTKLRNIFLESRSEENKMRYTKQRNFWVSFKKNKKEILWKSKWKACCGQQTILENSKTSPIW